jgi:hypothetical protein
MEKTGLLNNIFLSVGSIDFGRKGFATDGSEHEGRISYEDGLSVAMKSFVEALSSADAETIILAEHVFLTEDLRFCDPLDTTTNSSLTQAIASFDDALLALEAVQDPVLYRGAEKTYLHSSKYRVHGMPKDAFHNACISHTTRLNNILRTPGMNMTEKSLYRQRMLNIKSVQNVYLGKQKTVLP